MNKIISRNLAFIENFVVIANHDKKFFMINIKFDEYQDSIVLYL